LETIINADGFYSKPQNEIDKIQNDYTSTNTELENAEAEWLTATTG
jgi:hypothetical protein